MSKEYLNPHYVWERMRRLASDAKATAKELWKELLRILKEISRFLRQRLSRNQKGTNPKEQPPPQDEDGRYAVLDGQDQQAGLYNALDHAIEAWTLQGEGRIIDTVTGADVTPTSENFLSEEELIRVLKAVETGSKIGGLKKLLSSGFAIGTFIPLDAKRLRAIIPQINQMKLPVFEVTNIDGDGISAPTKTVPITRRKVVLVEERRIVEVESKGEPSSTGRLFTRQPTNDMDFARIRSAQDIRRVPASQLAMPLPILQQRIADRDLYQRQFFEEVPGERPVQKRKVWEVVERPVEQEWTDEIEVADVPQAQLLEVLVDCSLSMRYFGAEGYHLAAALMTVLISKHFTDGSRYIVRPFTRQIGPAFTATTEAEKRELVRFIQNGLSKEAMRLLAGTEIVDAVMTAAHDVRLAARKDDRPEILLITDAGDRVFPLTISNILGNDITLHTVIVGQTGDGYDCSSSLRMCSHTYSHLRADMDKRRVVKMA